MPTRRQPRLLGACCPGCGHEPRGEAGEGWCTHCRDRWGGVPGWWQAEPGGVAGWAAAAYAGPVRRAVLAGKRGAGSGLTTLLLERLPRDCLPLGAVVTWIPAHPRRALLRPDPGERLAQALARREGLPCARLLSRSPLGRRQAGRSADDRRTGGGSLGLRVRGCAPAAVVLVDDVRTTGATLAHAAELLRARGARHVIGVTVASARSPA